MRPLSCTHAAGTVFSYGAPERRCLHDRTAGAPLSWVSEFLAAGGLVAVLETLDEISKLTNVYVLPRGGIRSSVSERTRADVAGLLGRRRVAYGIRTLEDEEWQLRGVLIMKGTSTTLLAQPKASV